MAATHRGRWRVRCPPTKQVRSADLDLLSCACGGGKRRWGEVHQLGRIVLGERRLHLPGPQQCFGHRAQLLDVVAALDGTLMHGDGELAAQGVLSHGGANVVTTRYEHRVPSCGPIQPALAKAILSIRKPISAEALRRESVLATMTGGNLKPKANLYKSPPLGGFSAS